MMPRAVASPLDRERVETETDLRCRWADAFRAVRAETERRALPLSPEDQVVQSMPDASPVKWHLAHTTWFFEQFLLQPHAPRYRAFDDSFSFLFNSYYVAVGPRHARPERGLITRPGAAEVAAYRAHVDQSVLQLITAAGADTFPDIVAIVELGVHHEQQHQELLLTDVLHAFSRNPVNPTYDSQWQPPAASADKGYVALPAGIREIGHDGFGFCFDNELPRHRTLLEEGAIAKSLVTNGEWLEFIEDKGYVTSSLWLSDGWVTLQEGGWNAPGYWRKVDGAWFSLTLGGLRLVDPSAPVCHVSYYEADAYARWAGKQLPTEAEWEVAAGQDLLHDAFGIVWQWTRSAYLAYPGYRVPDGALGEYNGKFMINQMVLRGSSLATPEGHARTSYRNFFYPSARWQFSGLRLVDYR